MEIGEDNGPIVILEEAHLYHLDGSIIDFKELELRGSLPVSLLHSCIRTALDIRTTLDIPSTVTFRLAYYPSSLANGTYWDLSSQNELYNLIKKTKGVLKVDIDIHEDSLGVEWLVKRAD